MNDLYRIVDANVNRASEGLRVLEDLARLRFERDDLCGELRALRHAVRSGVETLGGRLLSARAAQDDVGLEVSRSSRLDAKESLAGLVAANFKRAQEALRVIEETLKLAGQYELSKEYEGLRFRAYALEQQYAPLLRGDRARAALDTDIYCITAEEYSLGRSDVQVVAEMLEAGITLVQYRAKEKETGARYRDCREIRRMTREAGATFIVNDHPGLALMVEADGVHVGQEDYPIEAVRALVGPEMIVGLSTHSPAQARDAVRRGADYIGVGPIYRTFTKKNVVDPVGLEYLEYAAANVPIPFVALGGVKAHNAAEVRRHGARCVALVTEIVGAPSIRARIEEVRAALNSVPGEGPVA